MFEGAESPVRDTAGGRCPACNGTSLEPCLTVTADEAAQHFVLKEQMLARHLELADHIRWLWGQGSCEITTCADCGSGFATPFVAGDAKFYNLAYPRVEHPKMKWEFLRTIRELQKRDTSGKSALEIGSGKGAFLDLACPRFFDPKDVIALEYNDLAVAELRAKGYDAASRDIRDAALDGYSHSRNFIFAFQVIEHMDRLDEVFDRFNYLSAENASLFIAVPNKTRTDYQEDNGSLIDMPPNHIGRWSLRALEAVGRRHGFLTGEQEIEPFDVREFVRHDLTYSYLRRSQRRGTVANRLRSMPLGRVRQSLELAFAAASVPSRAGAWVNAYPRLATLGASLWVHMRKA